MYQSNKNMLRKKKRYRRANNEKQLFLAPNKKLLWSLPFHESLHISNTSLTQLFLFLFLFCFLLTCNSHVTKFTVLKSTIKWFCLGFFWYSHNVVWPSPLSDSRTFLSTPQKNYSLAVIPSCSTPQLLTNNNLLYVSMDLIHLDISWK